MMNKTHPATKTVNQPSLKKTSGNKNYEKSRIKRHMTKLKMLCNNKCLSIYFLFPFCSLLKIYALKSNTLSHLTGNLSKECFGRLTMPS